MEGGAKWRPREMPHPPKADRRPAPARGCPSLTPRGGCLSGRKSIPILTQTEGNKGPLIPSSPSLPAWQSPESAVGTRAPDSRWLVLGAQTQECLLSGNTDPSWGRWRRGAKAPLQGDRPTHTCPAPLPLSLVSRGWCPAPGPATAKATSQANRAMQDGKEGAAS